jgi:hypothetical protein
LSHAIGQVAQRMATMNIADSIQMYRFCFWPLEKGVQPHNHLSASQLDAENQFKQDDEKGSNKSERNRPNRCVKSRSEMWPRCIAPAKTVALMNECYGYSNYPERYRYTQSIKVYPHARHSIAREKARHEDPLLTRRASDRGVKHAGARMAHTRLVQMSRSAANLVAGRCVCGGAMITGDLTINRCD